MIKINLYGGPSCGKSVLSGLLFCELKLRDLNTELVREFAKERVYEGHDMHNLRQPERIFIMAEQMRRESILHGKVDFLITDSPVLIAAFYYNTRAAIDLTKDLLADKEHSGDEYHFYIVRDESQSFEQNGRAHNEEESRKIDGEMINFLRAEGLKVHEIKGNPNARLSQILTIIGQDPVALINVNK